MKLLSKLAVLKASVLLLAAGLAVPASAGDWSTGGGFAAAGAGGGVAGYIDAYHGLVVVDSSTTVVTRVDTDPNYAGAAASSSQLGAMYGKDWHYVAGELVSGGSTFTEADSGKGPGTSAGTWTGGLVLIEGGADSDGYSSVEGAGLIASEESSYALDQGRREKSGAEASHLGMASVNSTAVGSSYAAAASNALSVSEAAAYEGNGGYSD